MSRSLTIVVVGGGVAGLIAAAKLGQALAHAARIRLVPVDGPDDSLGPFGQIEIADPAARQLAPFLSSSEDALLGSTAGSFALGTAYSGWAGDGAWFAPFGDTGAPLANIQFHQLAARIRSRGGKVRLSDYSLAALAAQLGRFTRPDESGETILSTFDYGWHLDTGRLAHRLRSKDRRPAFEMASAPFAGADLDEAGAIATVTLADGERVAGDLFLDCSGPRALLLAGILGVGFESWSKWLPCDRVVELACPTDIPPAPYAHVSAHRGGWRRTVPAQGLIGECLVYSSGAMDEEAADAELRSDLIAPGGPARLSTIEPGRRTASWHLNCVALGGAAAIAEPLQPSSLRLLRNALDRLLQLFPLGKTAPLEAAEYNRSTADELDRLRDQLIVRYCTNDRQGDPLWDAARAMAVPETVAHKLAIYRSRGRVPLLDGDADDEADWVALLDNHGIRPRRYDLLADAIPPEQLDRHFSRLREVMLAAAARLPRHVDYVRDHCPMESAA